MTKATFATLAVAGLMSVVAHAEQYNLTLTGTGGTSWVDGGAPMAGTFTITGLYDTSLTTSIPVIGPYSGTIDSTPITGVMFSSSAYTGPIGDSSYGHEPGSFGGRWTLFGFQWVSQIGIHNWTPETVGYSAPNGHTVHVQAFNFNPDLPVQAQLTLSSALVGPVPEPGTLALAIAGLAGIGFRRRVK